MTAGGEFAIYCGPIMHLPLPKEGAAKAASRTITFGSWSGGSTVRRCATMQSSQLKALANGMFVHD